MEGQEAEDLHDQVDAQQDVDWQEDVIVAEGMISLSQRKFYDDEHVSETQFSNGQLLITWRLPHPLKNQGTVNALKNCGLLKFFCLSNMRQQMELLQSLVHAWDPID